MAIKLRQDVQEAQTRIAVLDNSITVKIGDIIAPKGASSAVTNATAKVAGATIHVLGIVKGFCKQDGGVISTGDDPANTPAQLVTASDNLTVAKYHARYIPITPEMEFSITLSAAGGTTTGSDTKFVWFNLSDCRTIDETTVEVLPNVTTPLQVFSLGLDPEDTANTTVIARFARALMYRP